MWNHDSSQWPCRTVPAAFSVKQLFRWDGERILCAVLSKGTLLDNYVLKVVPRLTPSHHGIRRVLQSWTQILCPGHQGSCHPSSRIWIGLNFKSHPFRICVQNLPDQPKACHEHVVHDGIHKFPQQIVPRDAFHCLRSAIRGWQTFVRECHEHVVHGGIHKFPQWIVRVPAEPISPCTKLETTLQPKLKTHNFSLANLWNATPLA